MKHVRALLVMGLVLLTASMILAQNAGGGGRQRGNPAQGAPGGRGGMNMVQMRTDRVFRALEGIELSDQQKQTIEALRTETGEKSRPLSDELQSKTRDLRDRMQNDPQDQAGIQQMRQGVADVMTKVGQVETELIDKVKAVLTADQVKQFETALDSQNPRGIRALIDQIFPAPVNMVRQLNLNAQQQADLRKLNDEFRAAVEKLRDEYAAKIQEKLTPEQRERLKQLQEQAEVTGGGPGGPGMGGGAMGGNRMQRGGGAGGAGRAGAGRGAAGQ